MSKFAVCCGIVIVLAVMVVDSAKTAEPTKEEIAKAIEQLGDDDAVVRDKATKLLWEAGAVAEPALLAASKSGDADVVLRSAVILDKFRWGMYADTPQEVLDLIKAYRAAADGPAREKALRDLLGRGTKGLLAVRKIATAEPNRDAQEVVKRILTTEVFRAIPALVEEGKFDDVEEMLAVAAASKDRKALQDFTACLILRDRVDARIKQLEANPADDATAHLLAYLYRAKGDLVKAEFHARKANDEPLLDTLLFVRQDWTALLERMNARKTVLDETRLGFMLTCQVRLGKKEDIDRTVTALKELASRKQPGDSTIWYAAKPLFTNDMPDEALTILPHGNNHAMMIDVLTARMKFTEAMEIAEKLHKDTAVGWISAEVKRARLLRDLGQRKKADQLLDEVIKAVENVNGEVERREVVGLMFEFGRKDEAFKLVAERMALNPELGRDALMWSALFPKERGNQAVMWWSHFRSKDSTATPATIVESVREVMDGSSDLKLLKEKHAAALTWAKEVPVTQRMGESPLFALADWCIQKKLTEQERLCLVAETEVLTSAAAWQRLGEHDATQKNWKDAADAFRKAWELDKAQATTLWLWGWAVTENGDAKEGARLIERARWLPLGDEVKRYNLGKMQNSKGRLDDEAKEMALSERLALGETWHFGQAFYIASGAADRAKDYAKAGAALDVQVINVLRRGTFYRDLRAWVTSPSRVHYLKGRGFLADEKADEAMRELRASQELTPGDINLAIITVPILMKMGKAKFADEVFDKPWTTYTTLLKEYPDWALGHNNAAWLAARCRRQLDEALQHAQVAVRLDPERAVYLDTLAEIHFQKGDKAAAIDAIKKCIKLEPEREFFKKQLERFEAGDPKTDVPESR